MQTVFLISVVATVLLYMLHWHLCSWKNNGPRATVLLQMFLIALGVWQGYACGTLVAQEFQWTVWWPKWIIAFFVFDAVCLALIVPLFRFAPHDPNHG